MSFVLIASVLCGIFPARFVRAQTVAATSLTITPPFFTLNLSPGDVWASAIRVVNTNTSNLPVIASVTGFAPSDDAGHGTFVKISDLTNDADALANWIIVSPSAAVVPSGGATDIPFSVAVPKDASPGGHYAAILVGTQPEGSSGASGSHIGISSFISALIFVRVAGNVQESGNIEEFSTDKNLYKDPNVGFAFRFVNTGNVHVRPVGEIQIYNAFGREVGSVPINEGGGLGYVLPSSTRKFDATWQGSSNLWDIGEYTAVLTLAYGANGSKSVSQTLTFWVLPWDRLLEDALGLLLIVGAFIFFLRRSIRKMLAREMGYRTAPAEKKVEKKPNDTIDLRGP